MLSIRLKGDMLELRFESFMGGNEFKSTVNRLQALEGAVFAEEARCWFIPKHHVDTLNNMFPEQIAWHNAIEDIKGIKDVVLPDFELSDKYLDELKLSPYPFQAVGISFLAHIQQGLLADEMGLGKTPQAIGSTHRLWREGHVKKALVICPSSLKYQWQEEIQKFTEHKGIVIDGGPKERTGQYELWQDTDDYLFAIMNYELVRNDIEILLEMNYDVIIADEVHRIKNWASKTSKAMKMLTAPYKFGLTGTPMQNRPDELYNLFDWLNPTILGNWWRFDKKYVVRGEKFNQKNVVIGYKRLGELRKIIAPYMLRRMKIDVTPELPEMLFQDRLVPMTPVQQKIMDVIQQDFVDLMKDIQEWNMQQTSDEETQAEHPKKGQMLGFFTMMLEAAITPELLTLSESKMAQGYAKLVPDKKKIDSPKLDELEQLVLEVFENGNSKIVIFTRFSRLTDLIVDRLKPLGNAVVLRGDMKPFERQAAVDKFKYDSTINFFVTTDAGNYGLNLQFANTLIHMDLPWNPATKDQRDGRVHRIGSEHSKVNIIHMITKDSIDERIQEVLYQKRELADQIVEKNAEEREAINNLSANLMKKLFVKPKKKGK